ncbi:hypothetical protein C4577_06955 [Candidatus Parcubacteria bacterium]|nr:MAG: hypothetical protein C4577_06955 [Candidatus Parcubacteria bacterium]
MRNFSLPKKQKGVFAAPGIIVIATIIIIVAAVIFLGQRQTKGEKVQIAPSQLMPEVSAAEARTTICNLKKERLFAEACQSKFNIVVQEDVERIAELFVLLNKIQSDKSVSDYDRLLLSQAVFAALPTKDSPESYLYQPSILSRLKDYLISQNVVYAQEKGMSEEEFKKQMERDLQGVVDGLPKGNNAWVITVMVSKYSWIDGKRRPTYSQQYAQVFDPFPNNPNVNRQDINYNVGSVVGSKMSGQTVDVGGQSYRGTSKMIAYSFTIMSWKSQEYTNADGLSVEEKFLVSRRNFTENLYLGEHYLTTLLDSVKMPSAKRPAESSDKKESEKDNQTNAPKEITCEEYTRLIGSKDCRYWILNGVSSGLWCADTTGELYRPTDQGIEPFVIDSRPPDYSTNSFDAETCAKENDERNK